MESFSDQGNRQDQKDRRMGLANMGRIVVREVDLERVVAGLEIVLVDLKVAVRLLSPFRSYCCCVAGQRLRRCSIGR